MRFLRKNTPKENKHGDDCGSIIYYSAYEKKYRLTYGEGRIFYDSKAVGSYSVEADGISMTVELYIGRCKNHIYIVGCFDNKSKAVFNMANITYNNRTHPDSLLCSDSYKLSPSKTVLLANSNNAELASYDGHIAGAVASLVCAQALFDENDPFGEYFRS